MATSSEPNNEPTDRDDLDYFLAGINADIGHINPEITIDLNHKTIHCYICKDEVTVEKPYRLDETCPDCFQKLRSQYLRAHP